MSDVHLLLLKLKNAIARSDYDDAIAAGKRIGRERHGRVQRLPDGRRVAFDRFARQWRIVYRPGAEFPWIAWLPGDYYRGLDRAQPIIQAKCKANLRRALRDVAFNLQNRLRQHQFTDRG